MLMQGSSNSFEVYRNDKRVTAKAVADVKAWAWEVFKVAREKDFWTSPRMF